MERLSAFKIPILSEEGRDIPFEERCTWNTLWIVDPLDGTKEFIKRNDEFTVNIALVEDSVPMLGVIYLPVKDRLYFAMQGLGAFRIDNTLSIGYQSDFITKGKSGDISLRRIIEDAKSLPLQYSKDSLYTIVGSRSHATPELESFVAKKREEVGDVEFISAGSSLKICLVAEGRADIYPRLGPTMEWDTAAGQAIAEIAGASIVHHDDNTRLKYNKENLLNPWFIVQW
jgi:3'(2'), 5'-bisphosphate nucleotidase